MFNLDKFISDSVTFRGESMFKGDIEANREKLTEEIKGKKVCVIGGAGSIGSSFIKAVLRFEPRSVVVVDLNENGLAELVRDVRSTNGLYVPDEFRCYTLNFADPIFERIFREERGFDIVANFSAHKHLFCVSPEESGQICMLGRGGEVFFPKLGEDQMRMAA